MSGESGTERRRETRALEITVQKGGGREGGRAVRAGAVEHCRGETRKHTTGWQSWRVLTAADKRRATEGALREQGAWGRGGFGIGVGHRVGGP